MKRKRNSILSVNLACFSGFRAAATNAEDEAKKGGIQATSTSGTRQTSGLLAEISRCSDQPMLAAGISKNIQYDLASLAG